MWVTIFIQDTFYCIYFMIGFFSILAVEISINTTEDLFPINISDKFSFFTKNMSKIDKQP